MVTLDKLQNLIVPTNQPIEFGFEKEFVLQARSCNSGELYNLNLAAELIAMLTNNASLHGYSIKPEYSKCLIEIVSIPYGADRVFQELNNINNAQHILDGELKRIVREKYPDIDRYFEVSVSDNGSSSSCLYLNHDLTVQSDQVDAMDLVLPKYKSLVSQFRNLEIEVSGINEVAIGLYNHINSFHITLHPTYKEGSRYFSSYVRAITLIQRLVSKYECYDIGNKQLHRNNKNVNSIKNIRDIFLQIFLSKRFADLPIQLSLPGEISEAQKEFVVLSERLLKRDNTNDLDRAYRNWPAINLRPRIVPGDIPAIEIRQFGSNFSKTIKAKQLLQEIIDLDTQTHE